MLDNPPELSPDLEWLLPGVQASEELIVHALAMEMLNPVLHLTNSLLDDSRLAEQAALLTFVNVIRERHRYHGAEGVKAFVFRQALLVCSRPKKLLHQKIISERDCFELEPNVPELPEVTTPFWQAYEALDRRLQVAILLEFVHGLTLQEIGYITRTSPQEIKIRLQTAKERLLQAGGKLPESTSAEQYISDLLAQRWSLKPISQQGVQCVLHEIQQQLAYGKHLEQRRKQYIQAASISLAVVLLVAMGWITNRFTSQVTRNPFAAYTVVVTQIVRVPVYITQTPQPTAAEQVLTISSDIDHIRQRILNSQQNWHTLWAEALVFEYGPIGYVGPPVILREQFWIDDSGNSLLLSGKADGGVDEVWLSVKGKSYIEDYDRHLVISGPGGNLPLAERVNLRRLFPPDEWVRPGLALSVVGKVNTIGRDALILDVIKDDGRPVERLWVDSQTGVIVGLRLYEQDGITILLDIYLTDLVLNVEFPEEIFNPGRVRLDFSTDYRAVESDQGIQVEMSSISRMPGHEPMPRIKPPASFNPAQSNITFQWRDHSSDDAVPPAIVPVDVFADGYYLGAIKISDPWNSTCERSSDGNYLAIVEQPDSPPFPADRIQLLKLSDLDGFYEPLPAESLYSDDVAFSPDSQFMAFWGCGGREDNCGVYKLDLNTQKLVKLLPTSYAGYFVWRPDGEELAMLRIDDRLVVVNSSTGQITYEGQFNRANTEILFGSQTAEEGLDSLIGRKGLLGCERPGER